MWADSHCHLDAFNDREIVRAISSSVKRIAIAAITGCSREARTLAQKYDEVYLMAGIHPLFINETDKTTLRHIREIARIEPKCVAIGEIGLDYFEKNVDRETQKRVFQLQLELAMELNLPVNIHLRRAFPDFLKIIRQFPKLTIVMHMYSGSAEFARQLMLSVPETFFSFGGPAIRKNAHKTHKVLRSLPIERILVETDAPDLPPPGMTMPNIPANLPRIGAGIAGLVEKSVKDFEQITWNNAGVVFGW